MATILLREARWLDSDALLIALALAHGCLLLLWPSIPLVAIGLWWNANTISHNFIHRPFFHARAMNRAFSCYLSLLLGLPQSLWRARHLAHHGARGTRGLRASRLDIGSAVALWGLAGVAVRQGHTAPAARLLGAAEAALAGRQTIAFMVSAPYQEIVAAVREALGEAAFRAAWAAGRALSLEEVVAEALEEEPP